MPTLVEVRPLPVTKWHGKKDKEAFAQPKTIEVVLNRKTGRYNTGLTEEEAKEYGEKLSVDLSDKFSQEAHPYWSSKPAWIVLPNRTIIFDMEKPDEYVKVKNMKASNKVANSTRDWEEGLYPEATHVIFDENEEISNRATKIQKVNEAIQMLPKMSHDDKASLVQILSEKTVRKMRPDAIDVEISDAINKDPQRFIAIAKMGREEVGLRASILEMVAKNILTKEGSSYYYMSELIGIDYDTTLAYFRSPQNSKMKVMILEKLNNV